MPKPHNIASFMLRFTQELWRDPRGEPHIRWRGHIRHVQGDEEERFTDFAEAVTFMQRFLTQLTMDTLSGANDMSQEKVFSESFKLWNQFATSYAEMMSQALEQSLKQSETIREQVDEASKKVIDVWQMPYQAHSRDLVEAIENLRSQVEKLSERISVLEKRSASQ